MAMRISLRAWIVLAGAVFAAALSSATASAVSMIFTLSNNSSEAVTAFYVSEPAAGDWGDNILDLGPLPSGAAAQVTIFNAAKCEQDLRIEYEGGGVIEEHAVDLCTLEEDTYTITD